jgi:tRNA(His) guanylyltransferase
MIKDTLGDRQKGYEAVSKNFLVRRMPVIMRIDGKAFHTFARGFDKPFDSVLSEAMERTMETLCKNVQNCQLGYTQSDEISLLLIDDKTITTDSWFENNVQKMVSVGASIATMAFNKAFSDIVFRAENCPVELRDTYQKRFESAMFDCRAFNVPKEDVCNNFIWRQQDATRNSIQSVGQANFSPKQMHGLSCNAIQDKLFLEKQINWDKTPTKFKRGFCCIRGEGGWVIDNEIPIFSQDRTYIDKRVHIRED